MFDLALEAGSVCLVAIHAMDDPDRAESMRAELLDMLLEIADRGFADTDDRGERLFALVDAVAVDPPQRVQYLLAQGDWLVDRNIDRAVESWQTILTEPVLSATWHAEEGVLRSASVLAGDRLGSLIALRGAGVYAVQADFARLRLGQLSEGNGDEPSQFAELARTYPFADAARVAALTAARLYIDKGELRLASAILRDTYDTSPTQRNAQDLLGALADVARSATWTEMAKMAIDRAMADHGPIQLQPLAEGTPSRGAQAWREDLITADPTTPLPVLGTQSPHGLNASKA